MSAAFPLSVPRHEAGRLFHQERIALSALAEKERSYVKKSHSDNPFIEVARFLFSMIALFSHFGISHIWALSHSAHPQHASN